MLFIRIKRHPPFFSQVHEYSPTSPSPPHFPQEIRHPSPPSTCTGLFPSSQATEKDLNISSFPIGDRDSCVSSPVSGVPPPPPFRKLVRREPDAISPGDKTLLSHYDQFCTGPLYPYGEFRGLFSVVSIARCRSDPFPSVLPNPLETVTVFSLNTFTLLLIGPVVPANCVLIKWLFCRPVSLAKMSSPRCNRKAIFRSFQRVRPLTGYLVRPVVPSCRGRLTTPLRGYPAHEAFTTAATTRI